LNAQLNISLRGHRDHAGPHRRPRHHRH